MDKSEFIITQSKTYFQTQNKTLEQRLNNLEISKDKEQEIIQNRIIKTIRDKTLGLFKIGEVVSTILNWSEQIDEEVTKAKKAVLLENYLNSVDNHEEAINELKNFITNPQGNVLFNKILRILDDNPPDLELTAHLSSAIKYIINKGNFYKMFEKHKFAIGQIEMLSPQALTILADYENYPDFNLGGGATMNSKVTSEWNNQFMVAYSAAKGINSNEIISRISYVVDQLQTQGYLAAYTSKENRCYCAVTSIGKELLPYITNQ